MFGILLLIFLFIHPVFTWTFFIVFFTVTVIIITILFYRKIKKPDKFVHKSYSDNDTFPGLLNDLSKNLKDDKNLREYKSLITMMFFEKINEKEKISIDELVNLKKNNSKELFQIIGDEEIYNFIQNFNGNKLNKQKYLKEINQILDKMEAWD